MKDIKAKLQRIEDMRREKVDNSLSTRVTEDGLDYASAGLLIQHGLMALDEGIPNRQRMRVQLALMAITEGVADLTRWCQANGYFSDAAARKGFETLQALAEERAQMLDRAGETISELSAEVKGLRERLQQYEPFGTEAPGGAQPSA